MCSKECPCDESLKGEWGLYALDETDPNGLNSYGRTAKQNPTAAQTRAGLTGMWFAKDGVKTMMECVTKLSKTNTEAKQKALEETVRPF